MQTTTGLHISAHGHQQAVVIHHHLLALDLRPHLRHQDLEVRPDLGVPLVDKPYCNCLTYKN